MYVTETSDGTQPIYHLLLFEMQYKLIKTFIIKSSL
jgi:hypothetical protein